MATPRRVSPALALLALLASTPAPAGVFTLIQGANDVAPTASPPFAHWDLRTFPNCQVPYAVGRNPAVLGAAAIGSVDNAFNAWEGVSPALLRFRNVGAAPANTSANDGNNTVFWDNNLCNGDAWDSGLLGGAIGITAARMNAATGIYPDVDIVCDDAHFTWTNGTQNFPGGDDAYATEILGNGNRRTVITTGINGICESVALCGDVQVVAVGANGGANTVGVRTGNPATVPPAAPAPLIGSIRNFRGQMDVFNIMAHEVGHFCGLGENNGANTGSEVNEGFNDGPFNIPNGTTLSFTINGNPVNAALTAGPARTAAQVAGDLNAAIATQQPGQGNAIANPIGSVEIRATIAGQPVIVTGDAAAVAALGYLTGESGMSTMNQPDRRGLNSLDQRTLSRHDTDGLNFLYTWDLGDAKDPAAGPQGRYQTLVHSNVNGAVLNGIQLTQAGVGAAHLFGWPPNRYEWLGPKEDGGNAECEARVTDQDAFDDGFGVAGGRLERGVPNRVIALVNTNNPGGRYFNGAAGRLYFNGYFDLDLNKLFDPGERLVWWSGVPGTTGAASANFNAGASNLAANPMVLAFDFTPPANTPVSDSVWTRARLDFAEDEGAIRNVNGDLARAVRVAQFGEVEDYRHPMFSRIVALQCPPNTGADRDHPVFLQFCVENTTPVPEQVQYTVTDPLGWVTNSDLPMTGDFFLAPVGTNCINVQVTPPGNCTVGQSDTLCFIVYAPSTNQRDTCCVIVTCTVATPALVSTFDGTAGLTEAALRWTLLDASDIVGVHVYRSEGGPGAIRITPEAIAIDGRTEFTWTDRGLTPATGYQYSLGLLAADGSENRVGLLTLRTMEAAFALGRPSPNPTRAGFAIRLGLPKDGMARLRLHDVSGRQVATLHDGRLSAGEHTIEWNGRLRSGRAAESGIYFLIYEAAGRRATERVVIMR